MKPKLLLAATLATTLVVGAGCQKTNIQLRPPGGSTVPSPAYDGHYHLSLIGIIELSSAVNLASACGPEGPDSIYERIGVLGGLVNAIFSTYLPIFNVRNATVNCGAGGAAPVPEATPVEEAPAADASATGTP